MIVRQACMVLVVLLMISIPLRAQEPKEPFLRGLPPGLVVERSVEVPASDAQAIGQKLGGKIQRLTNSVVRVHGSSIQVNAITATDDANAAAIHAAMGKIKSPPFCIRKGQTIIEYVGKNIDASLAIKTSYELGLIDKPKRVSYRVTAELATVEKADYMACNLLFNQFLTLQTSGKMEAAKQIDDLSKRFVFGKTLALRDPKIDGPSTQHTFLPSAVQSKVSGSSMVYTFGDQMEKRQGIPFVTAKLEMVVDDTGFRVSSGAPADELTSPTTFWPTKDSRVQALVRQITAGKSTQGEKVDAILKWLAPGKNLKYSGQTGSRYGTLKVFEQKFGHCWDFSDCFVTLARAAGIPSRQVAGWLCGSSGHVWAEFYVEGKGWQQVDPTGGGILNCGIYHVPYFTSDSGEMPIVYLGMPQIEMVEAK